MNLFPSFQKARFLRRPNRFVVHCDLAGREVEAFLPNPGRLWELLFPDSTIYLQDDSGGDRKYDYTAIAVERDGRPIVLHTHKLNDVAEHLLKRGVVPGLEDANILSREVKWEKSRFDFLLSHQGKEVWLEVKSCTIFGDKVARFPDAVSARATRHLKELASLAGKKRKAAALILSPWPEARYFFPEYHVDLDFGQAVYRLRKKIDFIPMAFHWTPTLQVSRKVRPLEIPWKTLGREAKDRGYLLLVIHLDEEIHVGSAQVALSPGHYIYLEPVEADLYRRLARYRRKRKKPQVPVDHILAKGTVEADLPILTGDDILDELARAIEGHCREAYPGFSLEPTDHAHLFSFDEDPLNSRPFHKMLHHFRMERLVD